MEKVKILLASPTFHTLARKMNYLSLETYWQQLFDIIITVSAINFTLIWHEEHVSGYVKKVFQAQDDVLNTVALAAVERMRRTMMRLGSLSRLAAKLRTFQVMRYVHQKGPIRLEEFNKVFRIDLFESDILPLLDAKQCHEWQEIGDDEWLRMDFVSRVMASIRLRDETVDEIDWSEDEGEMMSPGDVAFAAFKRRLEGLPDLLTLTEEDDDVAESLKEAGYVQLGLRFRRERVKNLFACIGSQPVDMKMLDHADPARKRPSQPAEMEDQEQLPSFPPPRTASERINSFIDADLNRISKQDLYGSDENYRYWIDSVSGRFKKLFLSGFAQNWTRTDDAVKELAAKLKHSHPKLSEEAAADIAAARVISAKGQLVTRREGIFVFLKRNEAALPASN